MLMSVLLYVLLIVVKNSNFVSLLYSGTVKHRSTRSLIKLEVTLGASWSPMAYQLDQKKVLIKH